MALIATVGLGMSRRLGVSATLFGALTEADVNVRMIDQGSSEMNIIVGVENDQFEAAIRALSTERSYHKTDRGGTPQKSRSNRETSVEGGWGYTGCVITGKEEKYGCNGIGVRRPQ